MAGEGRGRRKARDRRGGKTGDEGSGGGVGGESDGGPSAVPVKAAVKVAKITADAVKVVGVGADYFPLGAPLSQRNGRRRSLAAG